MQFGSIRLVGKDLPRALNNMRRTTNNPRVRTIFGTRYVIDGLLTAADGRRLNVRTAWFIDDGEVPRFITAILYGGDAYD